MTHVFLVNFGKFFLVFLLELLHFVLHLLFKFVLDLLEFTLGNLSFNLFLFLNRSLVIINQLLLILDHKFPLMKLLLQLTVLTGHHFKCMLELGHKRLRSLKFLLQLAYNSVGTLLVKGEFCLKL